MTTDEGLPVIFSGNFPGEKTLYRKVAFSVFCLFAER
jgi:hypothetical protein